MTAGPVRPATPDPLDRAATARDGALALLTGLAANRSFATGAAGPRSPTCSTCPDREEPAQCRH